ncbi:DUF6941 family protein [Methylobacterium nonmethylotrophicum]|uniref:Uncharacterized protein n=1 Tax=Methylobacterium nonmethylotrophicum TaxID=1141884 RepID=A0A4Z0NRD3_9HYPH|nr:hypothetical protein [Methylobacterium nonmethylotrophicum]TGD99105.1 hypothetical protein EU555_14500 [Methylobacterium nonmethylotrophicum]
MPHNTATIRSVLLCDDIRQEITGKIILIGLYSTVIGLAKIPSKIRFRSAIILDIPDGGDYKMIFRLIDHSDNSIMETEMELSAVEPGNNILLPGFVFGINVDKPSNIEIQYQDGGWQTIGTWQIRTVDEREQSLSLESATDD